MLFVQVLVLVFTGVLWWIARRDLAARVPPPTLLPPVTDTAELEQLCATLETLVTSLARRLEVVERTSFDRQQNSSEVAVLPGSPAADPLPDPRYTPVYALLASGVSDPVEITRQTGLGRGEVDLILSLRDRRAF